MKLRSTVTLSNSPIDIAPLVDVVLLLLIFFMLTSSFVFQPGIKIDPPTGTGTGGVSTRYIVAVSSQTPPSIFFNDQLTSMEHLRQQLRSIAGKEANASIVLKADRAVPHGTITEILNLAISSGLSVVVATQPETPTTPSTTSEPPPRPPSP